MTVCHFSGVVSRRILLRRTLTRCQNDVPPECRRRPVNRKHLEGGKLKICCFHQARCLGNRGGGFHKVVCDAQSLIPSYLRGVRLYQSHEHFRAGSFTMSTVSKNACVRRLWTWISQLMNPTILDRALKCRWIERAGSMTATVRSRLCCAVFRWE